MYLSIQKELKYFITKIFNEISKSICLDILGLGKDINISVLYVFGLGQEWDAAK